MPTRARSHELEEESIRRFEDALPSRWVYRRKAPDYGIDGEVEIFEPDGRSTGLSFLVQLRATDDAQRGNVVPLKVSELEYYGQFDLPVAVVRYESLESSFFWQWASNIRSRVEIADDQESVGYRYAESERWTGTSGNSIRRTLEVRRALAAIPPSAALPLRIDLLAISPNARYPIDRALGRMVAESRGTLVRAAESQHAVEVALRLEPAFLSVGIDTLTGVTFDLVDPSPEDYVTYILYALVRLFRRQRLDRQAETLARLLVERGVPHHNDDLAFDACRALSRDLSAFVELAIINGFHEQQSIIHPLIALTLAKVPQDDTVRTAATDRFFEAAVMAGRTIDPATEAAAHYSIGNFYRSQRGLARAIGHYNRARRLRPAYLETGYYLSDLGGILYLAGHHKGAVRAYRAAVVGDVDPSISFRLGDALMLVGNLAEAGEKFIEVAARGEIRAMVYEAELKAALCNGLINALGTEDAPRRRAEANRLILASEEEAIPLLEHILRDVDALHPLAHFNLGVLRSREADSSAALNHFLHCAFLQPHDLAAWANAAISAMSMDDAETVFRVLAVAIHYMGAEAYDHLRTDLVAQGASDTALAALDELAMPLIEEAERAKEDSFTLRLLDGDSYHSMTIQGLGGA